MRSVAAKEAMPLPSAGAPAQNISQRLRGALALFALSVLAGCAAPAAPRVAASRGAGDVDPRYGVRASPRVVADGEEVPQGGGRYQVGKPYQIAGKTYYPSERPYSAVGAASWYGSDFHGRLTANGEVFDRNSLSAAHPTMPLPSYARVTNLRNFHSIIVRVNDRGPYHGGRVMDVSQRVAEALEFRNIGTARVKVEWLGRAELDGSDNEKLFASLRTDGQPASLGPIGSPVVITAERAPPARTADLSPRSVLETQRNEDEMTSLVESAAAPRLNDHAAAGKGDRSLRSAPLPPARPFDLGVGKAKARQAMN